MLLFNYLLWNNQQKASELTHTWICTDNIYSSQQNTSGVLHNRYTIISINVII